MADEDKLRDYLRRAIAEAHDSRTRLQEVTERAVEPIAIISMACRFPGGADTPEALWRLLADGVDAVTDPPANRGWDTASLYHPDPEHPGTAYTFDAAFLDRVAAFDAEFFGLSPREALGTDPQQRLLLEIAWEAAERAGIDPKSLRGGDTGTFVGGYDAQYGAALGRDDRLDGHAVTGLSPSVLSGRISYLMGLEGPTVTIDTACSSSLVAIHLAIQSLRRRECGLAFAGGVALLLSPDLFVMFSRQRGMAADGRSKAFSDDADGVGWGEGAGVVMLERLSDARRNGHPVLAVIRGSAINSDGASNGLTAPNGPSQRRMLRAALADAGLGPSDVDVVEAHGTGTTLGDPIEAQALLETYGQNREHPLLIGSIKSNIGHTQNAAGVAGVLKLVLAMRNRLLPPTLHVTRPSTHVDWSAGAVSLLTEAREWPRADRPMRAGVSAFGISGTNAHLILEEAPEAEPASAPDPVPFAAVPLALSARSPEALRDMATRAAALPDSLVDTAFSYATTRSDFEQRAVVVAGDEAAARTALRALAEGATDPALLTGEAIGGRTALLFTGQGSQRLGMGRELHARFPVFASAFDEVVDRFPGLRAVMWGDDPAELNRTGWAQPALFALEVALFRLVSSWGIRADHVAGHSVGEIAAAQVAGVFSLDDACALVQARAWLMEALPEGGAMVAVRCSEDELTLTGGVSVAAVNGPDSVVLSGVESEVMAVVGERKYKRLSVSHAFHSPLMDPMLEAFRVAIAGISFATPTIPLPKDVGSVDYWVDQVRDTVRFADDVTTMTDAGVTRFVELGPDGALSAMLPEGVTAVPLLRRDRGEEQTAVTALARLYVTGLPIDGDFFAGLGARVVPLPTYPFQHQDFWPEHGATVSASSDDFWSLVDGHPGAFADALRLPSDTAAQVLPALSDWRDRRRVTETTDSWRYRVGWAPLRTSDATGLTGTWLLVRPDDECPLADEVAAALAAAGASVRELVLPTGAAVPDLSDVDNMVSLLGLDERTEPGTSVVPAGLAGTTRLLRASSVPLWTITSGAVATGRRDAVTHPEQATLWGLGRVAALEQPGVWAGLVDLPESLDDRAAARLVAVLAGAHGTEDQVAVRSWGVFGRRLVSAPARPVPDGPRLRGTVLVTGGTGGLGGLVARWARAAGADHVVLVSRRGGQAPEGLGCRVTMVACDVSDRDALASVVAEYSPNAVVHAAGTVLGDADVAAVTSGQLEHLLSAKLAARHLHELTENLDAFVLFGSAAGVWGSAGLAGYSAANAYLDALAEHRAAAGLPAVSIGWGTWGAVGIAADHQDASLRLSRHGVRELDPALAVEVLDRAVAEGHPTLVVADLDLARFVASFTARRPSDLFTGLLPDTPAEASVRTAPADPAALLDLVRVEVAAVLGHSGADAVAPDRAFADLGFDSLTAVELRDRLSSLFGTRLPATLVFDHPTAAALAAHLAGDADLPTAAGVAAPPEQDPVVIVGMGCRLPGGVESPADLWRLLVAERSGVSDFPADRGWDLAGVASATTRGGFLAGAADFDAEFFGISPREALAMDPQQRLLLETTWDAVEAAGIAPESLRGSGTGVFVGNSGQDYVSVLDASEDDAAGHVGIGTAASVLSGRLAYTLGLEGPAVTVDTACSSSLVALHLAAKALRDGECSLALVGGVTVMSTPNTFVEFSVQGGLAADGNCKPFSDDADGTGWSEGVGVLVVARRSDAERAGYPVLAIVRGSAVNSDGASNGLTAPNGPSQQRVIRAALADAGLSTSDVDVVEAHGTGTTLGDPIEAQALLATYGQDRRTPLLVGSVKSNIGHAQAAAGIAGVIKSVLAMRSGIVPASLHVTAPTSHVDWSTGSVELVTANTGWPTVERPRRTGVSAFGVSGTNAHVVLEQVADEPAQRAEPAVVPWVLSARTSRALTARATALSTVDEAPVRIAAALARHGVLEHRAVLLSTLDGVVEVARDEIVGDDSVGSLAFLFAGQGSQRVGMGRALYDRFPVFADAFDEVADVLDARMAGALRDVMWGVDAEALNRTGWAQPALFAFEVALYRLVESLGVRPDVLVGHSVGEIAAAHVAGVFSLDDACSLVAARARLMEALPEGGAMVAIRTADVVLTDGVSVAAVNGPDNVVLSGVESEVLAAVEGLEFTRLRVSHAFHSPLMDPMLADFRAAIAGISFAEPTIALTKDVGSVDYWVNQVRDTVRFADDVAATGADTFLELGPDSTLSALVDGIPLLRRDRDDQVAFLTGLARLYVTGVPVAWATLFTGVPGATLPGYPFERTRYWPTLPTTEQPVTSWTYRETWRRLPDVDATPRRWVAIVPETPDAWTTTVAAALAADTVAITDLDHLPAAEGILSFVGIDTAAVLRAGLDVPVWALTRGAVAVEDGETPNEAQAAVHGFGRTAALEYPAEWGGLLDLPAELTDTVLATVARALAHGANELAVRESGAYGRRLVRAELPAGGWRPRGTVLVTGGTGALGGHVARGLAADGAEHLLLVSRRGTDAPGVDDLCAELREAGARVTVVAADAADREHLSAVLAEHPVTAIVHTAGVVHDGMIDTLDPADLAAMRHAKVTSALVLDECSADLDLDAFVLFASASAVIGNPGQAGYAAANAELVALAQRRHARGLTATAIAWGPWAGAGMAAGHRPANVPLLDPEAAAGLLGPAVASGEPSLLVLDLTDRRLFTGHRHHPLFAELPDVAEAPPTAAPGDPAGLLAAVRAAVASVLGHPTTESIGLDTAFRDLGFDSLTAVELRNRLTAVTGLTLPAGIVFDFPTVRQLTDHLLGTLPTVEATAEIATAEPVAIIGMACRFPGGVTTPEELWDLLAQGRDAVGPLPTDRGWDTSTPHGAGGFLTDVAGFDAGFFGISPREALAMDPQQRLLLETSWEAFENAGIDPVAGRGSRTGVFVGTNGQDYLELVRGCVEDTDGHAGTGIAASVLAGRISYTFGLEGPALTVDTACSSSLVALHLAADSLRRGECDLALAGGVTVMSTAGPVTELGRQGAVSPDGRCRAFAEGADGAGFAEGVGMLLVAPLSTARRSGYPILAVLLGSAVNQDGASNGLTAPNGPAQQRVITQALANAGLSPSDITAVEAHGTGTKLGDPIEAQALLATYGRDREAPLYLGSVKSNLGHTQAAAGVAGVMKMVLAMRHRRLPRTLHAETPSSHVDWTGAVRLLTEPVDWGTDGGPMRAGVSSFGISGTNAHVVLGEAPAVATEPGAAPPVIPYLLSARSPRALRDLAHRLSDEDADPLSIAATLAGRTRFDHRAVVVGAEAAELSDGLRALADDRPAANVVTGTAATARRVVLVFPGQGAQWAGMGAALLDHEPVFAAAVDECAAALAPHVTWSLHEVLRTGDGLERVDVVQPASWAMMVALARVWAARGVVPDAVLGHSQGEIAAAVVAGALSIEDAARVVALRSQAIAAHLSGRGAMASVAEPVETVIARLEKLDGDASIAAVNGPAAVVVSGDPSALAALVTDCEADDVRAKMIPVDYASHSRHVEDIRDVLLTDLAEVAPSPAVVPFRSTVTGGWDPSVDADYWYRNLRGAVGLLDAVAELAEAGYDTFVEVSPHPVLTLPIQETAPTAAVFGTLRRDDGGADRLALALAQAHTLGVAVRWPALPGNHVDLPTYPFQRERYWPTVAPTHARDDELWTALADPEKHLNLPADALADVLPALRSWREQRSAESTVDDWRYRVAWRPVTGVRDRVPDGEWLLVTASGVDDTDVRAAFANSGVPFRVLVLDETDLDRVTLAARLPGEVTSIVSLLAVAEQPCATHPDLPLGLALTITLVQALGDTTAPVWALTRGAVSTNDTEPLTNPSQALTLGVGWTAALEHPRRWGGVVDLPAALDERAGRRLLTVLAGGTGEDQLAIRATGTLARRVVRAPASGAPSGRWTPTGTTLVTGGTGQIGPRLVRWLLDQGATDIVLTSRTATEHDFGEHVTVAACDIADRVALTALLTELADAGRPVRTVVHAAAVIELSSLDAASLDHVARVVGAKATGARNLHELATDLDSFVLYSSNAGLWGSGDHAAYVAANAYLAALAQHRRAAGLPATAIHWGKWPDSDEVRELFDSDDPFGARRSGLAHLDPDLAMTGLRRALDDDETVLALTGVRWERYYPVFASGRTTTLFDLVPEVAALTATPVAASTGIADRLRTLPATGRRQALLRIVRDEAAAVLGHTSTDALSERVAFRDAGFDSVTAVDLRNRLTAATGAALPATLVFDHPNPQALTEFLHAELFGATTNVPVTGRIDNTDADTDPDTGPDTDPIVVVSMACRFPGGVSSPEDLWRLVADGVDAVGPAPADRGWDIQAVGGFLADVAGFDAGFFGISPREAIGMDPQQRLLLETTWETVERAGIDMTTLRGTPTGVFVGGAYQDYGQIDADVHSVTGVSPSLMSGRISYLYGFEGPAVTLDTGCSSALVALHLACQSLRTGESTLAIAGGATVMASPAEFAGFGELDALSAQGRCKAFGADADGFGMAEGVGVLLLERLSDARRNGHPVLAVVAGSAVNQDGASNGLTAPNGPSQQRVIRAALAAAGLSPHDVDVVEAHGTGTKLGDPIEAGALLATYGVDRETPLYLGSVKSNIGHTQLASGAASLMKMVLALRHGVLPPTLHADEPSPHVDWSSGALHLLTAGLPWPEAGRPRRGGVSSFGISGTNVHVILEQAPADQEPDESPVGGSVPWLVSGRSAGALAAQAGRLVEVAEPVADVGWSLLRGRQAFEHRAVVLTDHEQGVATVADGATAPGVVTGTVVPGSAGPVFVFPGQGSQWQGMGTELLATSEVFRASIDDCAAALAPHVDWSLTDVISGAVDETLLSRVDVVQPALFAMMVSLAAVWRANGVEPAAVVGHSQGEIAAAHVAGALSLDDAAAVVALRSKALLPLGGRGGMVSLPCSLETASELIAPWGADISVAAVNGPLTVVVSGAAAALDELMAACERDGVRAKRISVDYASHSPHVEEIRDELVRVLAHVRPRQAAVPLYSTVTGEPIDTTTMDVRYWYRNLRTRVRLDTAVTALVADGYRTFVEVSPHPVLTSALTETCEAAGGEFVVVGTLRRDDGGAARLVTSFAQAWVAGVDVDWAQSFGAAGRRVDLPTYAFQRNRYWWEPAPDSRAGFGDTEFWDLVSDGDADSLAAALDVDPELARKVAPGLDAWRRRASERSTVDSWRYGIGWTPVRADGRTDGDWLVVLPAGHEDDPWVSAVLDALGARAVPVVAPDPAPDRAGLTGLISDAAATLAATGTAAHPAGILSLLGIVEQPLAGTPVPAGLAATVTLVQAVGDAGVDAPVWCVTRGAVSTGDHDPLTNPAQSAVWGYGRVAALELPGLWGGLVDLPPVVDDHVARRLDGVLAGTEDQVAIRSAGVFGRRLVHARPASRKRPFRPTGTVLITGGTGGVGGEVARWVAAAGAEHLLLTSRRGPDAPGAADLADELRATGARVTVTACDVADREALDALLDSVPAELPLTAVFHAAGGTDHDAEVRELDVPGLTSLFGAKVAGAVHLHELTALRGIELVDFVLFSSGAGVWGSGRQPGYAAANAYLDALAESRRATGRPATSVAWGAWGRVGIAAQADNDEQLVRRGVLAMDPALAVAALHGAVEDGAATLVVSNMDWSRFASSFTAVRPSPLVGDLPAVRALSEATPDDQVDQGALRSRLDGLRPAEREREMVELVRAEAGVVLGLDTTEPVPVARPFRDFGLDSVTAVELRNRLRAATGLTLSGGVVFDYPTATALASYLLAQLYPEDATSVADPDAEIRAALATIPVSRLRQAGVLDLVLSLASEDGGTGTGTDAEANGDSLDDLDGEDLLRLAGEITN
ncbi:hypothetical protein BLA60_36325 [Actinophytocola xinjiangensis]|uniref:6-deoxyerythronolide-B synthase n=1 Tax=Actinophytocola xinjiangensis TaxID=485602 RepID=A0A7Z1AV88_9PSEU|nr:type I polyketide synthase [Actinophytocola xinjiangensis]OLF05410.1 hypothetical protein BLA60_36325 [Actinophytocola xinjiangensis]